MTTSDKVYQAIIIQIAIMSETNLPAKEQKAPVSHPPTD